VTRAQARRRFAAAEVARLATVDGRGSPHLVPIVFVLAGETIYSVVDAKPKRTGDLQRLRNVRSNPRASVLVDHYDASDWSALWWVRADGVARVLEPSEPEAQRAVGLLRGRYPAQRAAGPVLASERA
jgi:PPOX class probable F420-dependent enzyme